MPSQTWGCFNSVRSMMDSVQSLFSSPNQSGPPRIMPPPPTNDTQTTTVPPSMQMVEVEPLSIVNLPAHITKHKLVQMMSAIEYGREIGQGATFTVHEGVLEGREVAIKRFKPNFGQQFEKELRMVCTLDHPNILKMLGYCYGGGDERCIVYEMMQKGSLDGLLYGEHALTWRERLNVALQIARGVNYLHHGIVGEMDLIHCDLKPENILLDKDLNARISDFGAAVNILKVDTTQVVENLEGTPGYIDYHNRNSADVSRETDIFSFGSILCDMVRGTKVMLKDVPTQLTDVELRKLLNINLSEVSLSDIRELVYLSSNCRGPIRENRPSIIEVIRVLEEIRNNF